MRGATGLRAHAHCAPLPQAALSPAGGAQTHVKRKLAEGTSIRLARRGTRARRARAPPPPAAPLFVRHLAHPRRRSSTSLPLNYRFKWPVWPLSPRRLLVGVSEKKPRARDGVWRRSEENLWSTRFNRKPCLRLTRSRTAPFAAQGRGGDGVTPGRTLRSRCARGRSVQHAAHF